MARSEFRLERYVQRKVKRGREFFYFRVVRNGNEQRFPLPHPFDSDYRAAYNSAHRVVFGTIPGEFESKTSIARMVRDHRDSERFRKLPKASTTLRNLACDLMLERWGEFEASAIKPVHVQALYDSLADRPATANRRLDDISAVFGWGKPRGFVDTNPCTGIERVHSDVSYEPWPEEKLQLLIDQGKREIVKVALVAAYTGQRREDVLRKLTDKAIKDGVWYLEQGKTRTSVPVPLHPVVLAILDLERAARRKASIIDPGRPLLTNSRGNPWTPSGFGASWRTELIRLKLRPHRVENLPEGAFRATLHGLRHTNATNIANAVARNAEIFGGIARVQAMLGHLSESMSKHYARRAEVEHLNHETLLLLPEIGNRPGWIGNQSEN